MRHLQAAFGPERKFRQIYLGGLKIANRQSITFLLLLITTAAGCSSNENMVSELVGMDVPLSVIAEGDLATFDSDLHAVKRTEIYRSQTQLDIALERYLAEIPALTVDFSANKAVLLTLGVQSNIGSTFRVDGAVEYDNHVSLDVTYEASGTGCVQLGAFNHPYKLLEVSTTKIIVINERFELQDCVTQ